MKKAIDIIDDTTKSTLFGKFYEKIISEWLKGKKDYTTFVGKPRVYWDDARFIKDSKSAPKFKNALEKCDEKYFCTPDGFVEKDGKYYIWEAKNWPIWVSELSEVLFSMPSILATQAFYRTKRFDINGFLFFWWSKPEGSESLEKELKEMIAPHEFDIFYMTDILDECISEQYSWYLPIIKNEKDRIDLFFNDLLGQGKDIPAMADDCYL